MKKIIRVVVVTVLTVAMFARNNISYAAYSGSAAVKYAERWWDSYNTGEYYKVDGADCTNFVSQCLVAGGKKPSSSLPSYTNTNYWRPHSATWENATYWRKYWKSRTTTHGRNLNSYTPKTVNSDLYLYMYTGDVIQWGFSSSDIGHSQLVQGYKSRSDGMLTLYMIQHTSGRQKIDLYDYITSYAGFSYVCGYHFSSK